MFTLQSSTLNIFVIILKMCQNQMTQEIRCFCDSYLSGGTRVNAVESIRIAGIWNHKVNLNIQMAFERCTVYGTCNCVTIHIVHLLKLVSFVFWDVGNNAKWVHLFRWLWRVRTIIWLLAKLFVVVMKRL